MVLLPTAYREDANGVRTAYWLCGGISPDLQTRGYALASGRRIIIRTA